jgi:mono/diheme cytochrome c family protein
MRLPIAILTAAALACAAFMTAQTAAPRNVWDGIYTTDQAKRGEALYGQHCGSCHGGTLDGGEAAPPLAGAGFLSNWSGLTVGELFERIRTSMPLDNPGKLSRQDNADILAHILKVNNFPAGEKEMSHATEVLKEIRLDAAKPGSKK